MTLPAAGEGAFSSDDASLEIDDRASSRVPFQRLSQSRVCAVLNCLTEATFFYRADDPDLFDYLRRHRGEFERFFEQFFAWDLYVDRKVARLFKRGRFNAALTPKQRNLFDLTRRDECIVFMLLLEFHEQELARQNIHYEHDENLNFLLSDFVEHVVRRYQQELEDLRPTDREIFANIQSLFRQLEKHRFICLLEKGTAASDEMLPAGQSEQVLYSFLPGIHCYDPGRLSQSVFRDLVASGRADADADADANAVAEDEEEDEDEDEEAARTEEDAENESDADSLEGYP